MIENYDFAKFRFKDIPPAVVKWAKYEKYDTGIVAFCGPQGCGKTTSMVSYLLRLIENYGDSMIIHTNIPLNFNLLKCRHVVLDLDSFVERGFNDNLLHVFVIDEISTLFSSLESKNMNLEYLGAFCQLRRQRVLIVSTAQVYTRIAKGIREQISVAVVCSRFWIFQRNYVYKMETKGFSEVEELGEPDYSYIYIPNVEYDAFDSAYIVKRKKEVRKK